MIATFGAIGEPAHNLHQLLELLRRPAFIIWVVGTMILVLVILFGSRMLRWISLHSKYPNNNSSVQAPQSRVKLIRGMSYGLVSGILSAHMLLLAKSAVELLVRTVIDRVNQFNRWQSWVILVGMVMLALVQLFCLHHGLKLCSTSVLYPFVFCIYNIIAILDGLIYFRQIRELDAQRAGLIALGTVVLLTGVLCLSWRLEDSEQVPPMDLVEEAAEETTAQETEDEESRVGSEHERSPLLMQRVQTTPSSSLLFSPSHRVSSLSDIDSAYVWAELEDSEDEFEATTTTPIQRQRPRSRATSLNIARTYGTIPNEIRRRSIGETSGGMKKKKKRVKKKKKKRTKSLIDIIRRWI